MPYRKKKFFLKKELVLIDKIEPKSLRDKIIEVWPSCEGLKPAQVRKAYQDLKNRKEVS